MATYVLYTQNCSPSIIRSEPLTNPQICPARALPAGPVPSAGDSDYVVYGSTAGN